MKFYVYKLTQFLSFMKSWNDFLVIDASQTTFSEIFFCKSRISFVFLALGIVRYYFGKPLAYLNLYVRYKAL